MLNNTEKKQNKYLVIPKELQKRLLHNTVRDCLLANHYEVLSQEPAFQSFETAICLLGQNIYSNEVDTKLENALYNILYKYRITSFEDFKNLDSLATIVIKEWKKLIKIANLNNQTTDEN